MFNTTLNKKSSAQGTITNFLKKFHQNNRAQGTIEYLIILAVVVVIGLVLVGILGSFSQTSSNVSVGGQNLGSQTGSVIVVREAVVDLEGTALLSLQNNTGETLTLDKIVLEGAQVPFNTNFFMGSNLVFLVPSENCFCTANELTKTCNVEIHTTSKYGLTKKEILEVKLDCVTNAISTETVIQPDIESFTLTYNSNGATSGTAPSSSTYFNGQSVTVSSIANLEKTGFVFLEWNTIANGSGTSYSPSQTFLMPSQNLTLYAIWEEEIGEFDCDEPLAGGYFCNGSGTIEDPYGITTIEMLQNIKQDLDAHYILLKDIEASETEDWNCTEGFCGGFEPIGGSTIKFTGSLDGNNYSINYLYINRPTQKGVGLFGYTDCTTSCFLEIKISNLNLADANIIGKENVGGLIGDFHCGRVENSSVTGTISTPIEGYNGSLGGLIGYAVSGVITNSFTKANLSSRYNVGGLIGTIEMYTQISNCYTDNNISGHIKVGGLVGSQRYTNLSNSYSKSNVTGYSDVGGIAGANYADGIITKTYSTGTITSSNGSVGGLVGLNHTAVSNSFSTAQVTGSINNGGLIGYLNLTPPSSIGSVTNSYWDILKTGQNNCYSSGSTGCTSTNNEENLYYGENGIPFTELGFGEEWVTQINNYPILAWQN